MASGLTIITVNRNNAEGLMQTINSVISQNFSNYEYIVIDGASTDNSVEIIKQFEDKINYWVSEPDSGIYNAMNKGIKKSNGKYLLFLNSGDYLFSPDSIQLFFENSNGEDLVYADIIMQNEKKSWNKIHPSQLTFDFFLDNTICHQATIIKKDLFEKIGLYNENNKILSDWEFFLEAICLFNVTYKYISAITTVFADGGISTNPLWEKQVGKEKEIILSRYASFLPDYKELRKSRSDLNIIRISRLHKLASKIQNLKILKNLKK